MRPDNRMPRARRPGERALPALWPEKDLTGLRAATTAYLASLAGPAEASARTDAQREFATVLDAMTRFAGDIGATKLAVFPATTGVVSGTACGLAP